METSGGQRMVSSDFFMTGTILELQVADTTQSIIESLLILSSAKIVETLLLKGLKFGSQTGKKEELPGKLLNL